MADLPQDQQPTQEPQTSNIPTTGQPDKSSFPPMQEETPSPPTEESLKAKFSSLGIKPPEPGTPSRPKKGKIILAVLALFFLLASIPAAVYLVQQRQEIRKRAYPGQPCSTNEDCPGDECCGFGTGTCRSECYQSGDGYICCNGNWVPQGQGCADCAPAETPTPTPPGENYCSQHGFTRVSCSSLPGDFADCEASGGHCCKSPQGNPFCCWANGMCSGGFRSGCSEVAPGAVKVENNTSVNFNVTVEKNICGPGVCPCTAGDGRSTVVVGAGTSRTFSLGANQCGQIEVFWTEAGGGGCGSCKTTGCEEPEETPTPTLPPDTAQCDYCKVYDSDWNEITDLSTITVGQTVYFATLGSTSHPEGITKAKFRINEGTWQETTLQHEGEFYIQYTIPAAGSYKVESEVYNPALGWK